MLLLLPTSFSTPARHHGLQALPLPFPTPACHQGATLLSAQATRLFIPADLPKSLQEFG